MDIVKPPDQAGALASYLRQRAASVSRDSLRFHLGCSGLLAVSVCIAALFWPPLIAGLPLVALGTWLSLRSEQLDNSGRERFRSRALLNLAEKGLLEEVLSSPDPSKLIAVDESGMESAFRADPESPAGRWELRDRLDFLLLQYQAICEARGLEWRSGTDYSRAWEKSSLSVAESRLLMELLAELLDNGSK